MSQCKIRALRDIAGLRRPAGRPPTLYDGRPPHRVGLRRAAPTRSEGLTNSKARKLGKTSSYFAKCLFTRSPHPRQRHVPVT